MNDTLKGGGAERVVQQLSTHLSADGYIVDLVLCRFEGELLEELSPNVNLFVLSSQYDSTKYVQKERFCRVPSNSIGWFGDQHQIGIFDYIRCILPNWPLGLKVLPRLNNRYVSYSNAISKYFIQHKPDIVFAVLPEGFFSALMGIKLSRCAIPIVCSVHTLIRHDLTSHFGRRTFDISKKLLSSADAVHTVSRGVMSDLYRYGMRRPNRSNYIIHTPVSRAEIDVMRDEPTSHHWVDNKYELDHIIFLTVGRLVKVKNHKLLIDAFARVSNACDSKLIILGDGPERKNLENQVAQLNLKQKISLPGWVRNPFSFMHQCDVFVMSSEYEALSNVIIEALQCGCRIVSVDCPYGPSEILENGRFGTLVPIASETALATAMLDALEIPVNRQLLRKRAYDFTWETIGPQFEKLISEVRESFQVDKSPLSVARRGGAQATQADEDWPAV